MAVNKISLNNADDAVTIVLDFLSDTLSAQSISPGIIGAVQLATEEAVVNIISHGYNRESGIIEVFCRVSEDAVTICIRDEAPEFNPLDLPSPDIDADLLDRRIGGLGVHLIRSLMDDVRYKYTGSGNCLIFSKKMLDSC